ncbi:MAG: hypothetical protein Q8M76_15240, partial [Spirochaetaceae bacterium]|nr:hypothetical protein [Spirochaetaceae bacterium]
MADLNVWGRARRRSANPLRSYRVLAPALALALLLALALATSCSQPAVQELVEIPGPGTSSGWLVRGPFAGSESSPFRDAIDEDFLAAEGGEAAAHPGRIQLTEEAPWRELEGEPSSLDFLEAFAELGAANEDCVAYGFREIESSEPREVVLKLGSDDGMKVWINGALVFANRVRRPLKPDEDAVVVALPQGKNRFLVKVGQATGAWGFSLRVRDLIEDRAEGDSVPLAGMRL